MNKLDWLAGTMEEAINADEEIVDPHHHLWDFPTGTYLLPELHEDTGSGHNVVQTVFVECGAGYRSDGPEYLRPVGEIEFVAQQAELSKSSGGGRNSRNSRICRPLARLRRGRSSCRARRSREREV